MYQWISIHKEISLSILKNFSSLINSIVVLITNIKSILKDVLTFHIHILALFLLCGFGGMTTLITVLHPLSTTPITDLVHIIGTNSMFSNFMLYFNQNRFKLVSHFAFFGLGIWIVSVEPNSHPI